MKRLCMVLISVWTHILYLAATCCSKLWNIIWLLKRIKVKLHLLAWKVDITYDEGMVKYASSDFRIRERNLAYACHIY